MTNAGKPRLSRREWLGATLSVLAILFLLFDSVIKLMQIEPVRQSFESLGYDPSIAVLIGLLELACLALYAFPRTAVLGAVLLTGLLGGAVASHLRLGHPLATHVFFGVYVGLFVWGGLWLRDPLLRDLFPWRRAPAR